MGKSVDQEISVQRAADGGTSEELGEVVINLSDC